jgi:tetratricopeptide (TPR) repeat protein
MKRAKARARRETDRTAQARGPAAPAPAASPHRDAPPSAWLVLALLLATAAAFSPVVRNGFISMDDDVFVTANPMVARGLRAETVSWALRTTELANWYPLTRLSHLLDVSLFGMRAGGHHAVSLLWHAAAAAVLFLALRLATGAPWRAFLAAALFALHPLQVESVAWAAERSMVLSGFFLALTLWLWVRHARSPAPHRLAAALAAFALGLAAKPTLVTLPFLLLLLDLWPLGRLGAPGGAPWRVAPAALGRRLLEKAPFFALSAASCAVTLATQEGGGAMGAAAARLPLALRLGNAGIAYARYTGKLLWPAGLAVYYPHPAAGLQSGAAAAAWLGLGLATAAALLALRRRPWLAAGWLWFAGALVPMAGLVQVGSQAMADRYAYLPSIGLFVALAWTASEAAAALRLRGPAAAACALALLAALGGATALQARLWRDSGTLYAHALAVTRDNFVIENNLGNELLAAGRLREALPLLESAVRLNPAYADARRNLGTALHGAHRLPEAREQLGQALALRPDDADAHHVLGLVLYELGLPEEAVAHLREASRLRPGFVEAISNLGNVFYFTGRYEEAAAAYREALRLQPDFADARANLAVVLGALGRGAQPGR